MTRNKQHEAIQPTVDNDVGEAAQNTLNKRAREVDRDRELEREAAVRRLLRRAEVALTGNKHTELQFLESEDDDVEEWGAEDPDRILARLGDVLEECPGINEALHPAGDVDQRHLILWRQYRDQRARGVRAGDLVQEWETYLAVAMGAGVVHSPSDKTRMAPVRVEALDIPGQRSGVEEGEQTPVGRRRLAAEWVGDPDDAVAEIPTRDAAHVLGIGRPRSGKDNSVVTVCGNLKDEHGYKWVSLYDDGRWETPAIAIPSDDPGIKRSLDEFGVDTKGYKTTVWCPMVDLPDKVPSNFKPFSVGVDALTTDILCRLSGVSPSKQTEHRVGQALNDALDAGGSVQDLIRLLGEYADDATGRVTVERMSTDGDGETGEAEEWETFEMGEEDVLESIAESLVLAAGSGIIRDAGADTNIDMAEVLRDQDRVAILNANYVEDDSLKHLIILIWMELIWDARGEDPSLPRVCVEVREIKNLAPSKLSDVKYRSIAQALKQMFYLYSSQGSARRIMMAGSTQKNTDMYKSVRSNMGVKLLMKLDSEIIDGLDLSLTGEQKQQLRTFETGWGMLVGGNEPNDGTGGSGEKIYPIQWRGARCGLGYGDKHWRDRYAEAAGWRVARVDEETGEWVDVRSLPDEWIDGSGDRVDVEDRTPNDGEWYLLPGDVEGYDSVEDALWDRCEAGLPELLWLEEPDVDHRWRFELLSGEEAALEAATPTLKDSMDVPPELDPWLEDKNVAKRDRWLKILRVIDHHAPSGQQEIADRTGASKPTVSEDLRTHDRIGPCAEREDGEWQLTRVGERALEIPWDEV